MMNTSGDGQSLLRKAIALQQAGRIKEAQQLYREILSADPHNPDALHLMGLAVQQEGEFGLAEQMIRSAIAHDATAPLFHLNLANACSHQGKSDAAIEALYQALSLDPLFAEAHFNLANELLLSGRAVPAISHYRLALKIRDSVPEFHYNLGKALEGIEDLAGAEESYLQALNLRPDYRDALYNLSVVLYDRNRTGESVEFCHRLLSSGGKDLDAVIQMSFSLLKEGRLREGWRLYEARLHKGDSGYLRSSIPRWNGEMFPEGTLLVRAEQGLGDVVQFSRYLKDVKERVGRVTLECQPSLVRMMHSLPWIDQVVPRSADLAMPSVRADLQIPLLSLPGIFDTSLETIPLHIPYIQPSAESVARWGSIVKGHSAKRKVGIVWSGNRGPHKSDRRSADPAMCECLMQCRDITFFSLQMGDAAAELRGVWFRDRVVDLTSGISNFDDTAGLISHLDLVISIDTSVAHLAGAMGSNIWTLLPYSADWRWLVGREDSPWYPTMRLFRQPRPGDWAAVFREVAAALDSWTEDGSGIRGGKEDIAAMLSDAVSLHRQGRSDEADEKYRSILMRDPGNADALHLAGVLAHQEKDYAAAERYVTKAIAIDSYAPIFRLNLGNILRDQGKVDGALRLYREALTLEPRFFEARFNLANELLRRGDFASAIGHYTEALALNARTPEVHGNLARALVEAGRFEDAEKHYAAAIELDEGFIKAYLDLGILRHRQKRQEDAKALFQKALELKPDLAEAHFRLGNVLREQEDFGAAEEAYRKCLEIRKDSVEALNNLAVTLKEVGRFEEALAASDEALRNMPDFKEALNTRGLILRELGRLDEAIESSRRALSVDPEYHDAHWNLSLALLQQGNYGKGWEKYEWRFRKSDASPRAFPCPRWDGADPSGKTILVYGEQGIGDQVMFASVVPDLAGAGARCIIECNDRLVPLFARSFPGAVVIPIIKGGENAFQTLGFRIDYAMPIGSLPMHFRRTIGSFPRQESYLAADPQEVLAWKARFDALGTGLKVGISWFGGGKPFVRRLRSVALDGLLPLLKLEGAHFINLQYGDVTAEIRDLKETTGVTVHHWEDADPLKDLDGFAAKIRAIDLVISVDNSTVHMAGALGVPVWALLPAACDWRWLTVAEDTPWYASVRLIRQRVSGDWETLVQSTTDALRGVIRSGEGVAALKAEPTLDRSYRHLFSREDFENGGASGKEADLTEAEKKKYRSAWMLGDRAYARHSPGLQISQMIDFLDYFKRNGVRRVLDAGIGSGKLCRRMMDMGFECHGLDIADNCLDPELLPLKAQILTVGTLWNGGLFDEGSFDAVVCTDVLEHIPTEHVDAVLRNLYRWTRRFVFLQVALFEDIFGARIGETLHLTVQPKQWWDRRLSGFRVIEEYVSRDPRTNKEIYASYLLQKVSPAGQ